MTSDQALWIGIWLGGSIVLLLEHLAFPFGLWVATSLSRKRTRS